MSISVFRRSAIYCEVAKSNKAAIFVSIGVLAIFKLLVLCSVGAPVVVRHYFAEYLPPLWIYGVLGLLDMLLCGYAIGFVLGAGRGSRLGEGRYRGAFYFVVGVVLGYVRHLLMFGKLMLIPALIAGIASVFCLFICAIEFFRAGRSPFISMLFSLMFGIYNTVLVIVVIFSI